MKYVFISYVHQDFAIVKVLRDFLVEMGIEVWLDTDKLEAGKRWKGSIRNAIREGAFFIACFSENYNKRNATYMNEELVTAIEELRLRPYERSWFIPVRLSDCEIPDRPIGGGESLRDIQRIDLFPDFVRGCEKLGEVLIPALLPKQLAMTLFETSLELHLEQKINHFKNYNWAGFEHLQKRWLGLLATDLMTEMSETFSQIHARALASGQHQMDQIVDSGDNGRYILISAIPHRNVGEFLELLSPSITKTGNRYLDTIIEKRRLFHTIPSWQKRDFVHLLYFDEESDDEITFDMLYLDDYISRVKRVGDFISKQKQARGKPEKYAMREMVMYPTSVISAIEAGILKDIIDQEDVAFAKKVS